MLYLTGTGRCYYRYRNVIPDVVDEFNVKATIGNVLINAVKEYFPGTQLLTGLCQL